jgi:hypothetical protein
MKLARSRTHLAASVACMSLLLAPAALGCAQQGGEKTVKVKDAWGNETSVKGFQEERQAGSTWFIHDPERPQPRAAEPGPSSTLGAKPPEGAVVLFDGKDASGWTGGPWRVADGYMEVNGTGNVTSKAEFGDARLHLEFATPADPKGVGQDRGNSGVFLMGRYEVQILDSWKSATYPDGMVGAVYGQNPPSVNASRPPGEWQTYDITFTAPRFDENGGVRSPARVTVLLNGVKVQDDYVFLGETPWRRRSTYVAHGPTGPLGLQDHGHPVRFRNIWFVPIKGA